MRREASTSTFAKVSSTRCSVRPAAARARRFAALPASSSIDEGEIAIGGTVVNSSRARLFVPPNRRDIGMVFQNYGIWPHMNVFDNVAFPVTVWRSG